MIQAIHSNHANAMKLSLATSTKKKKVSFSQESKHHVQILI